MSITITATYEDGVLRPSQPLDLPEHSRIEIQIQRTFEPGPLTPASFSKAEQARRAQIVRRLRGLWSAQDEAAFKDTRQALWGQ